jgi:hypothetical protein
MFFFIFWTLAIFNLKNRVYWYSSSITSFINTSNIISFSKYWINFKFHKKMQFWNEKITKQMYDKPKDQTCFVKKLKMQAFTKKITKLSKNVSTFFANICKCQIIFGSICSWFSFFLNYKIAAPIAQGNRKG